MAFSIFKLRSMTGPFFTLVGAFILNMFPWGNSPWVPDFLLITLAFWVLQAPDKINLLSAFLLGLLMDIQTSQYLGVHAIVYVVACFVIIYQQRRLLNSTLLGQTFVMLQVFFITNFVLLLIVWVIGQSKEISFAFLIIPSMIEACLWPIFKKLLSNRASFINHHQT
jgi:rod shape-determining protein MreD